MNFHQFEKPRHTEIPFICQPVSPTPRDRCGAEFRSHYLFDTIRIRRGVKIEVRAEVRPVVERFYDSNRAAFRLQGIANVLEPGDRTLNASLLSGERGSAPTRKPVMVTLGGDIFQNGESANDYMICISQFEKFRQF